MRGLGIEVSLVRCTRAVMVLALLLFSASSVLEVTAQEDTTDTPAAEQPAQELPQVPAVEPAPPVEPAPVEPAPVEPAPVEPAASVETGPVEPAPPVEEPAAPAPVETEVVVEPVETAAPTATQIPTAEPTATVAPTATAEPSPTPSPTPEPTPVVTWSQTDPVKCELRNGAIAGLKYQQSNRYFCEAVVNVSSNIAMPEDMKIEWKLDLAFPDSYVLEFPADSQAVVKAQVATGATSTQYTITQPWVIGSGAQKLNVQVVVTRNTCAVGEQVLTVQAVPSISTGGSEAEIKGSSSLPAVTHTELFLPNTAELEVEMTPVDFGSLQWDGTAWGSTSGSSTITITNPNPCASDLQHIVKMSITADQPGMTPVVAGTQLPEGFVAGSGDVIAIIPPGFTGTQSLVVEFELTPTNDVPVGEYSIGFDVSIKPAP